MPDFTTGHVGLNVQNLSKSKEFYENIFGFHPIYESAEYKREFVFLGDGERLVLTLWQQSAERFSPSRSGLHHLSFKVGDIQEVISIESKLRESNIPIIYDGIVPHSEGQSSAALYFEDPDGIRLEVYTETGGEDYVAPKRNAPSCGFF